MDYEIGDRVRLALPYGGLRNNIGNDPQWVEVGDEGEVIDYIHEFNYPIRVAFDGKRTLTCSLEEIEPV